MVRRAVLRRIGKSGLLMLAPGSMLPSRTSGASAVDRREFTRQMAQVRQGMTEADVVGLLGKPDDIIRRTAQQRDSNGWMGEIWGYGTETHGGFPTLGSVTLRAGKVEDVRGGSGLPPAPELLSEAQLRQLLPLLDRAPEISGSSFDPLPLIQSVNRLQPLGKERALAAVAEYLRVSPRYPGGGHEGQFLVLRLLFDVPKHPGYFPTLRLGLFEPYRPVEPRLAPRFPLLVVHDVPLVQGEGFSLAGAPEWPEAQLHYWRQNGILRAGPLRPPDNPFDCLPAVEKSREWVCNHRQVGFYDRVEAPHPRHRKRLRAMMLDQLRRLGQPILGASPKGRSFIYLSEREGKAEWARLQKRWKERKARWNPRSNTYWVAPG